MIILVMEQQMLVMKIVRMVTYVQDFIILLRQAMMMDPLVGAICSPPEIAQMVDDLIISQAEWLPQYARSITAARQRASSLPRLPTQDWQGAARLPRRSVEELRRQDAAKRAKPSER